MLSLASVLDFPSPFQTEFATKPDKIPREKKAFDARTFFRVMLHLVAGANKEGYDHALMNVFNCERERPAPTRSAFCQLRQLVKWKFFKAVFYLLIREVEDYRTTFGGLRIYAIDCQQLTLPRTKDLRNNGFNGRALEDDRETHTLRAYFTHCYDVLTGISKGVTFHNTLNEHRDRKILLPLVEEKSLVLYDALYFSEDMIAQHRQQKKCYFLAKCRLDSTLELRSFRENKEKQITSTTRYGKPVYFVKVVHPKSREEAIFATDLPEDWIKPELVRKLYRMRWPVETSFFEMTAITKCEQWHSKSLNGILQEFFCLLWLINFVKICMLLAGEKSPHPLEDGYRKANFKLCFNFVVKKIGRFWSHPSKLVAHLIRIVKQSTESRKRGTRCHPRELKGPRSPYPYNNTRPSTRDPPLRQTSVVPP